MPINSKDQLLASDICEFAGDKEYKNFRKILGAIKRLGYTKSCQYLSEIKEGGSNIRDKIAMFMYKSRYKK